MSRPPAEERLRRILAAVPWIVAGDGPTIDDVCARFGYRNREELQTDLEMLFLCGVPPYTPDVLIDVEMSDDRVWIRYADYFARPLQLSTGEALALVAASAALLGSEGSDTESPLATGLAKLARALGIDDAFVDVDLGPAPSPILTTLRDAAATHRRVEIDYYGYGRDERSTRVIDPVAVYSAEGQWYVAGWCHVARDERLFRVDRVERATTLEETFTARAGRGELPVYDPRPEDPRLVLDLAPEAAWVLEQYPTEEIVQRPAGPRVALRVSGDAWLARLLLRLGPHAKVVAGDATPAARAARRVLERYGAA